MIAGLVRPPLLRSCCCHVKDCTQPSCALAFPGAIDSSQRIWQTEGRIIAQCSGGLLGKIKPELITFINDFKKRYDVPLDPIYTGKMMYGIFDLMEKQFFPKDAKILAIHTGGLQGIEGMNITLKRKGWPLIK